MKRIAVLIALILVPVFASAQSTWVTSKYFVDNGTVLHDGPVLQATYTKAWGGYYINPWISRSFDGKNSEIDYTGGWSNEYVDLHIAYNDLEPVWKSNDIVQATGKLSLPKQFGDHELTLFTVADYVYARDHPSLNSGEFFRIGVSDTWRKTVRVNTWILHDSGIFQGQPGFIARGELGVDWKRGKYTYEPSVRVSVPFVSDRKTQYAAIFTVSR